MTKSCKMSNDVLTSFDVVLMDKFLVKAPTTSLFSATGKVRPHLPPKFDCEFKDRAGKYPAGTFPCGRWIDVLFVLQ